MGSHRKSSALWALFGLIGLLVCTPASAQVVTNGITISDALIYMGSAGYKETGLDMVARRPTEDLRFWHVGEGVLIATYSRASKRVLRLGFWLTDGRPKAVRRTFDFEVAAFEPRSGLMTIQAARTEPDGAANRSQPVRSETNSTPSAAGSRR